MIDSEKCPLKFLVYCDEFYHLVQDRLEDPNERDGDDNTLLHKAAWSRMENCGIVQLLLDRGADVDSTNQQERTPLHFAVCGRNRYAVAALIEAGASVNSKDILGRTPLHFSITKRWPRHPCPLQNIDCDMWIVERLLNAPDIFLNPQEETGETPLMWAVKEQNSEAVGALLRKGANPNITNYNDQTPLHVALSARYQCLDVVVALLTNGADIYIVDDLQQTQMDILVRSVCDDETYVFASICLWWIALRYQIRDCLIRKLKSMPALSNYLNECCNEVTLMREIVIYDKFTLHDFALNSFQDKVESPVEKIYIPVVENLLSGFFRKYFYYILFRISLPDLCRVLQFTAGHWFTLDLLPSDVSHFIIFDLIERFYDENSTLKTRLRSFRKLILKKV